MDTVWVGADPGGSEAFGVAIIVEGGEVTTACVSCADEAVAMISTRPAGVGVDAPLWWSSGRSAEREADRWIRRTYGISAGTECGTAPDAGHNDQSPQQVAINVWCPGTSPLRASRRTTPMAQIDTA